jgi:ABC-type amino acid transport substrate-binding protein
MRRRPLSIVLLTFLAFNQLLLADQVPTDMQEVIKAASEYEYPPFCIVSPDGKADGFSVELLRASLAAVNRKVEFKTGPWTELKQELSDGVIQVLPLVGRTPEREEMYDFTFPYLTLHGAVFVRTGDDRITDIADIHDKKVAVMKGDNAEEFCRRTDISSQVVALETYHDAMQLLANGGCDAVIAQRVMGLYLLKSAGIEDVVDLHFDLTEFRQDFCFAVRSGDKVMLSRLRVTMMLCSCLQRVDAMRSLLNGLWGFIC